jgi:PAS domain-containing protein
MSLEFDQISSQIPIVMWTTDKELNFTSVAGGGLVDLDAAMKGRGPAKSVFELFQTDDPEYVPIAHHRRALRGESVNYEFEFEGHFYDTHLEPLRTGEKITGVIGVATDITDQKRAS